MLYKSDSKLCEVVFDFGFMKTYLDSVVTLFSLKKVKVFYISSLHVNGNFVFNNT